ncbi:MAG: crotonase/enoyl-CoA hydratase family protein [Betaproteobacteria bacterium]|nr:crotonase/enoyl-CoA hydratase family protein [Betaproteobacteria bacterium]
MNAATELIDERVRLDVADGIAHVTLARPDKHNAMDFRMLKAVVAAQARIHRDANIRVVLLRGEGPSFCAGLDVKSVLGDKRAALWGFVRLFAPSRNIFQQWSLGWRDLPVPVVALIHGNCLGAGMQLALGADLRITTPDARLAVMEAKWGLVPDMGGTVLLRELVPIDIAKRLTLTAEVISGADALALGLVTEVADDPLVAVQPLIANIRERSPDAVAAGKFLLQRAWPSSEWAALAEERKRQRQMFRSPNLRIAAKRNLAEGDPPAYLPRKIGR